MSGQSLRQFQMQYLANEGQNISHYPLLFNSRLPVSVLMKIDESFAQLQDLNPSIIGGRAVALLEEISTEEAICAIDEFCNRYRWASHKIQRSISGYFRGVCKKYWKQNREQHKANFMRAMKIAAASGNDEQIEHEKARVIDQVVDILFTTASGLSKDLVCSQKRKVLLKFDYYDAIEALYEFCNAAMYREHKIRSMHAYLSNIIKRRENNPISATKLRHIQKRKRESNRIKRIRALKQDQAVDECRSMMSRLKVGESPPAIDIPTFRYEDSLHGHSGMSMGSTPHDQHGYQNPEVSPTHSTRSSMDQQPLPGNQQSSPHGSAISFGSNHVQQQVQNMSAAAYIYGASHQVPKTSRPVSFEDTYEPIAPTKLREEFSGYQLARTPSPVPMTTNSPEQGEYWGEETY